MRMVRRRGGGHRKRRRRRRRKITATIRGDKGGREGG